MDLTQSHEDPYWSNRPDLTPMEKSRVWGQWQQHQEENTSELEWTPQHLCQNLFLCIDFAALCGRRPRVCFTETKLLVLKGITALKNCCRHWTWRNRTWFYMCLSDPVMFVLRLLLCSLFQFNFVFPPGLSPTSVFPKVGGRAPKVLHTATAGRVQHCIHILKSVLFYVPNTTLFLREKSCKIVSGKEGEQ